MQDAVGAAVLGQANVGDNYTIPTGVDSEMLLMKQAPQENTTEMTTQDGSVRMNIKGNFPGCSGAVDQQVCRESD